MPNRQIDSDGAIRKDAIAEFKKYFAARNLTETATTNGEFGQIELSSENDFSPESESPFDYLYELRNEDEKVLELISHIQGQLNIDFAERLTSRIQFLFEVSKEEYPDEIAIISGSLRNFISFLQSSPNLNYPDVVLTPSKNIRVQWKTANNRHFAVEFLSTGDTQFVVFSPDQKHPERTIRLSGLVSLDSLMETVKPHGILGWSSR